MKTFKRQQAAQYAEIEKNILERSGTADRLKGNASVEYIDINELKMETKPRPLNKVVMDDLPELPYAVEEALNRLRVNISFLDRNG